MYTHLSSRKMVGGSGAELKSTLLRHYRHPEQPPTSLFSTQISKPCISAIMSLPKLHGSRLHSDDHTDMPQGPNGEQPTHLNTTRGAGAIFKIPSPVHSSPVRKFSDTLTKTWEIVSPPLPPRTTRGGGAARSRKRLVLSYLASSTSTQPATTACTRGTP